MFKQGSKATTWIDQETQPQILIRKQAVGNAKIKLGEVSFVYMS